MKEISLRQLPYKVLEAKDDIWDAAVAYGRDPMMYLHWSAGHYGQPSADYHLNIDEDGTIYMSGDSLSTIRPHTWCRNSGAVGIAIDGCYGAGSNDLGNEPPTEDQIETMAKCIAVLCEHLEIPCDKQHVLTHGEAANNEDGLHPHPAYAWWNDEEGDGDTRGDLEYLETEESPEYNPYAEDGSRGGDVLRGKANWYLANGWS